MDVNHNVVSIFIDATDFLPESMILKNAKSQRRDGPPQDHDLQQPALLPRSENSAILDRIPDSSLFVEDGDPVLRHRIAQIQQQAWEIIAQEMDDILPARSSIHSPPFGYFLDKSNRVWLTQCMASMHDMPKPLTDKFTICATNAYLRVLDTETLSSQTETSIFNPVHHFR